MPARARQRAAWEVGRIRMRWGWRLFERRLPEWVRRTLPWGSSLLAHAALLFVLAVVMKITQDQGPSVIEIDPVVGQLRDDVTSLKESDRAGDSFTTLDALEPPSLPRDLNSIDDTVIAIAELPSEVRLGPKVDLEPEVMAGEMVSGLTTSAGFGRRGEAGLTSPMLGRSKVERAKLVRREGGTVESEKAVERGLEWIARHQRPDGGWSLNTQAMCVPPGCPERPAMQSDTAATGLALLPLLGAGHTHTEPGRYQKAIYGGLNWLVAAQQPDGSFYLGDGGAHAQMYSHAIGTMAICESYALTKDKRLREPARKAVAFITRSQHVLGGWRYQAMAEGDTSVHGWMLFALRSADIGGIPVPKKVVRGATRFLNSVSADKVGSAYAYMPGRGASATMTAEALVCRQILGWARETPGLLQGAARVWADLEQSESRNIYYWYYATQLLHNMRDKSWEKWNARVRDGLIDLQVKGNGCDAGSWDPMLPSADEWGDSAGRLYTTSLSLLTLEVYYRYLPMYKDRGGAIEGGEETETAKGGAE